MSAETDLSAAEIIQWGNKAVENVNTHSIPFVNHLQANNYSLKKLMYISSQ